jgi:predicted phage terminase large subunit-like protein
MATTESQDTQTVLKPYYEQEPFLNRDKKYYGFVSGVGAGKTMAGIIRTALNMEEWNPGEMGAIVAPTTTMIKDVIINEMRELGLLDHYEYKSSYSDEPGLHAPNGSRALILSADNRRTIERLRGLNLAWWWMDEESIIEPRAREILMQRLRTGKYRNGYITTTPKGKNHTYDFFVGKQDTEQYAHGEGAIYEADDRLAITSVPSWANPHTPEDYHEAMGDLPEEIRAQEVEGNFVEIGSGIFKRDMIEFVRPSALSEDKRYQYYLAVDPAVQADTGTAQESDSDYWAATLAALDKPAGQLYALDCARERGMSLREGVEWIKRIGGEQSDRIYVEANQSQRWLKQELQDAGLNAIPIQSYRDKEERIIDLSVPIERGDVVFVNRDIDDQLGYDPRWQDLIQEMLAFPEGSHDDMVDSLHLLVDNCEIGSATSILGADPRARED